MGWKGGPQELQKRAHEFQKRSQDFQKRPKELQRDPKIPKDTQRDPKRTKENQRTKKAKTKEPKREPNIFLRFLRFFALVSKPCDLTGCMLRFSI